MKGKTMLKDNLELLMPAGSLKKLKMTLAYGADAVYLGPPLFSLRARENHFGNEELKAGIDYAHSLGKKAYMTLNIFARNRKLKPLENEIEDYRKMKPDAFIMSDPGFASMVREAAPEIPIHLSVQANCTNWQSVKFWQRSLGIERVILSRELSIEEITEIKNRVPEMELEAFVHGSICIAYSGRCLLSSYMDKRDANQGVCDNSCREKYKLFERDYFIQENSPGMLNQMESPIFQIDEDEHGTYVLNAKDLCMIEHLDKLKSAGVISFKVEGRTKSEFYAAMVARSYRGAIDDLQNNKVFNPYWLNELNKLSNRGYHTGFMLHEPRAEAQNYQSSTIYNDKIKLLGISKKLNDSSGIGIEVKNKLQTNQIVEVITAKGQSFFDEVIKIESVEKGEVKEVHSGMGLFQVTLKCHQQIPEFSLILSTEDHHSPSFLDQEN